MKATLSHRKGAYFSKDATLHVFSLPAREEKPAAP